MIIRDRVAQRTTSNGTGNIVLGGQLDGFLSFVGADIPTDVPFPVLMKGAGEAFEIFESTLIDAGGTLTRGDLIRSNTGSRIDFGPGEKRVYLVAPAEAFGGMGGRSNYAVTGGAAPHFTAVFPVPVRKHAAGTRVRVRFHAVGAGADDFAPDGIDPKPIKTGWPLRATAAGDIALGAEVDLVASVAADCWIALNLPKAAPKEVPGNTYNVVAEDAGHMLVFTHASGCAVALPQATGQFAAAFGFSYLAAGGGAVTFTAATSTINLAASLAAGAGAFGEVLADAGGNYRATVAGGNSGVPSITGAARDLLGTWATNSRIGYTAAELVLKDAAGAARLAVLAAAVDLGQAGISGLDTGAEASSTWYHVFASDLTNPLVNAAVTANAGTDRTHNAHGLSAGQPIKIGGTTAPAGVALGDIVYLRDVTANDYKITATPGGAAIDLTTAGAAVTVSTVPGLLFSASPTAPTMPAGHTFKAYLGAWYNDGSSNLRVARQRGSRIQQAEVNVLNNVAPTVAGTYQSLSISVAVPPTAKTCSGNAGHTNTTYNAVAMASDAAGLGVRRQHPYPGSSVLDNYIGAGHFDELILGTAQTVYWTAATTTANCRIGITDFTV